jgi:quinol monooxygenase YgiN
MKEDLLHVKVQLKIKPECREAFERELMAIREKCIREKECLAFDVERRSDDPNIYLLIETWSDRDFFEKIQLNRDYYPPYFAKIDRMMAAPREIHYWTRVATYAAQFV